MEMEMEMAADVDNGTIINSTNYLSLLALLAAISDLAVLAQGAFLVRTR
jgi:hypothetical protein